MTTSMLQHPGDAVELRSTIARLRDQLARTTDAYHRATANRDSIQAIPLLRIRSQLMRQLLEFQCELLMTMRSVKN